MTENEFLSRVYLGLGIAAVIVVAVAVLVIAIILTARSILTTATQALGIANDIVEKTQPIWALETTNAVAVELLEGAQAIEEHAAQVATALEAPVASR